MTFKENYQSKKTLLANQLINQGVDASDKEGMTTLINKINDIPPRRINALILYTDKNVDEKDEYIQIYALLVNNSTPVSGATIHFTLNNTTHESKVTNEYGIATLSYLCTGAGTQTIIANYNDFVSNELKIIDALFYDSGLTDAKWDNHYTNVTLSRELTNNGTKLYAYNDNGFFKRCYLAVNGEQEWVSGDFQIDFDFTFEQTNATGFQFWVGSRGYSPRAYFNSNNGTGHFKIIVKTMYMNILLTIL